MFRLFLRFSNFIISLVLLLFICLSGSYAAYALWDNNRVYSAAENVQADMLRLKPTDDGQQAPTFQELQAINPDVCAWVSLDNTKIDHPVLQGKDNMSYINTDVYGNFALAGSIFLDSRNARDFTDPYSLLYGHHMENSQMFGDLDLYKDADFFRENSTGLLMVPNGSYDLEIFACMLVNASDDYIFEPDSWQADISRLLDYIEENALYVRQELVDSMEQDEQCRILALSTCASEFSDARTIVLANMKPRQIAVQEDA